MGAVRLSASSEPVAQLGLPVTTGAELVGDLEQVALDLERVVAPTHRGERVLEDAVRIDRRGRVSAIDGDGTDGRPGDR